MNRAALLCVALFGVLSTQTPPPATPPLVVLDGDFTDWDRVPVAVHDPADATTSVVDFKDVRVTADDRSIYVQVDFSRTIGLQSLAAGTVSLLLDEDNNAATGQTVKGAAGIDLVMEMGQGVAVRRYAAAAAQPLNIELYDTGFLFAPRFASPRFEFRVDRAAARQATIKLVFEQAGSTRDETDTIPIALPSLATPVAPGPNDVVPAGNPLRRADGTAIRVVIWNVSGMPKTDRGRYLRMLRAIDADLVMLDEADPRRPAADVAQWLQATSQSPPAGTEWHSLVGHAFQGTIVAARGNLMSVFDRIPSPGGAADAWAALFNPDIAPIVRASLVESGVGTMGAMATIGGRRLLGVPVDLTSGGAPESANDARRVLETAAIATAAHAALAKAPADAVFIGGDFNLVGSRDPVDVLLKAGLDIDHSSLADARALTLDRRSNATWRNLGGGRFTAGRLDWLLYSDSSLEQVGGFVFDTAEISPYWLARHHLFKDDSERTSDHLPVVADFRWKRADPRAMVPIRK